MRFPLHRMRRFPSRLISRTAQNTFPPSEPMSRSCQRIFINRRPSRRKMHIFNIWKPFCHLQKSRQTIKQSIIFMLLKRLFRKKRSIRKRAAMWTRSITPFLLRKSPPCFRVWISRRFWRIRESEKKNKRWSPIRKWFGNFQNISHPKTWTD